jgi:triosephosphate isomerase (TIM)
MTAPRPLVAGNWKMNGLKGQLAELAAIVEAVKTGGAGRAETAICPPFTLVAAAAEVSRGTPVAIGAQDCHANASGAHTGDVSAEMLADAGAKYVIVGHSERRADHGETDQVVREKAKAVLEQGLVAIVCVGETKDERVAGKASAVVGGQIDGSLDAGFDPEKLVVAYEPVWAIGTGLTPTAADVAEIHAFIRGKLEKLFGAKGQGVRILYGGSVKPNNAAELMGVKNVDGALVGGASLKCADFIGIAGVYR